MSTQIQRRRGTTTNHASFTGAVGETTVDTTKKTVVVHDGSTAGGNPLMREDFSNVSTAEALLGRTALGVVEYWCGTSTNATNAYSVSVVTGPAPTGYGTGGMTIRFTVNAANTGAATLNVNTLGAKNITKNGTTALASGDMPINSVQSATYDGTQFQLDSLPAGNGTVTSVIAGTGLTGGTINTTGTIAVDYTAAGTYTGTQAGTPATLTDASTIAWAMSGGNNYEVQLGGSRTLGVPTAGTKGQSGSLNVIQDGTGSRTLAYSWCYTFGSGSAPTLTTTALAWDKLSYDVVRFQSATVSCTSATPMVMTYTGHGLKTGDFGQFSGGTQPTGFSLNTSYWITVVDANTLKLSSTKANAAAGTFIASSSTGTSPVFTVINVNMGLKGDLR